MVVPLTKPSAQASLSKNFTRKKITLTVPPVPSSRRRHTFHSPRPAYSSATAPSGPSGPGIR